MNIKNLRLIGGGLAVLGIILIILSFVIGPKTNGNQLNLDLKVKEQVITGAYKAYGVKDAAVPMWLVKAVFRNDTGGRITDLRVRYRVSEYAESDWSSWHRYPAVDPGQTVVDLYFPIFSAQAARLTSRAPADLHLEYEYNDPKGRKNESSEERRITMLARHEFLFSDLTAAERTSAFEDKVTYAPLLAAWVTRADDEVVGRLASYADKLAGGLGAQESDDNCMQVIKQIYELMRTIHISYQHPQGLIDPKLSFDIKSVQSLQYPRDTIQKRSGTCIDLAILMASLMNSVSIEPVLVVLDGHCFPLARLPKSGQFLPVEATGVGDGYEKSMSFEEANKTALQEWKELMQTGRYVLVPVREYWMDGVSNPELEPMPPDILEKWGVMELLQNAERGQRAVQRQAQGQRPQAPGQGQVQAPPGQSPITGNWAVTLTMPNGQSSNGRCQVTAQGNQIQLVFVFAYQQMGQDGLRHQIQEVNPFSGSISGQNIQAICQQAQVTVDGNPMAPQGLPYQISLVVSADGRSMQGQFASAMGGAASLSLVRQ
jgi:hypothetical protein